MAKKGIPWVLGAVFSLALAFTGPARAKDLLVPLEYASIQSAIIAAAMNDVIKVAAGTYPENIVMKQGLALEGGYAPDFSERDIAGHVTVIDGGGKASVVRFEHVSAGSLSGFTITNGNAGDDGGGIRCSGSSPAITDNILTQNRAARGGAISIGNNSSPFIKRNTLLSNMAHEGGGIFMLDSSPIVANNLIVNNSADTGGGISAQKSSPQIRNSIFAGNHAAEGGAMANSSSSSTITNCTVVRNSSDFSAFFAYKSSPTIKNTIFWQNGDDLVSDFTAMVALTYSDLAYPPSTGRDGNIFIDPLFVDLEGGIYQLEANSPCINAGDPAPSYSDQDGSRNDMGAFGGPGGADWPASFPRLQVQERSDSNWLELGLYGGAVYSVAIDPFVPNKFFATSYMGDGLFVSENGGMTWNTVEGFRNYAGHEVSISESTPDTVWVAYFSNIARSKDGGSSWSKWSLPDRRYALSVAIDPVDSNTVYVGAGIGMNGENPAGTVFKTTNEGQTWQQSTLAADEEVARLAISRSDPKVLWALTGYSAPGSAYKSIDGADHWQKIELGFAKEYLYAIAIDPSNPEVVFIAGYKGIVMTRDGGKHWVRILKKSCNTLAIDPARPGTIYANIYDRTGSILYKSKDSGKTWQQYPLGDYSLYALAIDPHHSESLLAGDYVAGTLKSVDGGAHWQLSNEGIRANIVFDSAFAPNSKNILMAGAMGGLFRYDQTGMWTKLFPASVYAVAFSPNGDTLYLGVDYGLVKSTDNGRTWTKATGLPAGWLDYYAGQAIAVDPRNPQVLYLGLAYFEGNRGEVYTSVDAGQSFSRDAIFGAPVGAVAIDPTDSQTVYAGTSAFFGSSAVLTPKGALFRKEQGQWTKLALEDVDVNSIQIAPSNSNMLYVGSGDSASHNSGLYRSDDRGVTWVRSCLAPSAVKDIKIDAIGLAEPGMQAQVPTSLVYAATYRDGVFQSVDAGTNWVNVGLSDYKIFDISINTGAKTAPSLARDTSALSPYLIAGTNSCTASSSTTCVYGEIQNSATEGLIKNASVCLDTGQCVLPELMATGTYSINVAPGHYTLVCTAPGFKTASYDLLVESVAPFNYDFQMEPAVLPPQPDLKVNGQDGPITINRGQAVDVTVSLDPGQYAEKNAEWWILLKTEKGWFSYVAAQGWVRGRQPYKTAPLAPLAATPVWGKKLPKGTSTFYFNLDDSLNGLDDTLWSDSVLVTVQ